MYNIEECRNFEYWMLGRIYNSEEFWYIADKDRNFIHTCYSAQQAVSYLNRNKEKLK